MGAERDAAAEQEGSVRLRWRAPKVIEATFVGHIVGSVVQDSVQQLDELTRRGPVEFLIIDGRQIASNDTTVREPGQQLLRLFQTRGGDRAFYVSESRLQRLLASTLALAARAPMKILASLEEADAAIKALAR